MSTYTSPNPKSPFSRSIYPTYNFGDLTTQDPQTQAQLAGPRQVFTGADLQAYCNTKRVGNLESVTWSISVEMVGNYIMGQRDAVAYTTGKRVIVGSAVFSQYDKHAFLEEVWQLSTNGNGNGGGIQTLGDLWGYEGTTYGALAYTSTTINTPLVVGANGGAKAGYTTLAQFSNLPSNSVYGLSPQDFDSQVKDQLLQTAQIVGSQIIRYSDQIPPFDLTLIGVNPAGAAARAALFGVQVSQETSGFSQNDLSNAVGLSFVALAVDPWEPIAVAAGATSATLPGAG